MKRGSLPSISSNPLRTISSDSSGQGVWETQDIWSSRDVPFSEDRRYIDLIFLSLPFVGLTVRVTSVLWTLQRQQTRVLYHTQEKPHQYKSFGSRLYLSWSPSNTSHRKWTRPPITYSCLTWCTSVRTFIHKDLYDFNLIILITNDSREPGSSSLFTYLWESRLVGPFFHEKPYPTSFSTRYRTHSPRRIRERERERGRVPGVPFSDVEVFLLSSRPETLYHCPILCPSPWGPWVSPTRTTNR